MVSSGKAGMGLWFAPVLATNTTTYLTAITAIKAFELLTYGEQIS